MGWFEFLDKACLENHIENVHLALKHISVNSGLHSACKGGRKRPCIIDD